ncbi:MAG: hypothetical protein Phog2KO_28140 [Phototrophicaceae bacterium]
MIDYSYDGLSRLIEADYNNGTNVYNYGYDVAGNLVDYDGVTRTYNAANQMVNDGTNTLSYDNNGNLRTVGSDTYTWDRVNRLLSVGNHSYVYDGLSNRVQQTVSSVVTDYLNDVQLGLTKLLKQDDGTNVEHFVHAPRGIHAVDDGTDWTLFAQDGLGSVRGLFDDVAVVQTSVNFDPYGNPMGSYDAGFGFTGEQTDKNGSAFLRARYYEPSLGVFSALDPFEGIQKRLMSLNGYSWVEGNVPNMIDPTGLELGSSNCGAVNTGVPANIGHQPQGTGLFRVKGWRELLEPYLRIFDSPTQVNFFLEVANRRRNEFKSILDQHRSQLVVNVFNRQSCALESLVSNNLLPLLNMRQQSEDEIFGIGSNEEFAARMAALPG